MGRWDVSQKEIADKLDISRSKVSKILNNDPKYKTSPEIKKKVIETAKKMGYDFNSLYTKKHGRRINGKYPHIDSTKGSKRLKNVRRSTIIKRAASITHSDPFKTKQIVNEFLNEIIKNLGKGNRLEFRGFGIFKVVIRKKKLARNPRTNEEIMVPERKAVRFKMGKDVKKRLNP